MNFYFRVHSQNEFLKQNLRQENRSQKILVTSFNHFPNLKTGIYLRKSKSSNKFAATDKFHRKWVGGLKNYVRQIPPTKFNNPARQNR